MPHEMAGANSSSSSREAATGSGAGAVVAAAAAPAARPPEGDAAAKYFNPGEVRRSFNLTVNVTLAPVVRARMRRLPPGGDVVPRRRLAVLSNAALPFPLAQETDYVLYPFDIPSSVINETVQVSCC